MSRQIVILDLDGTLVDSVYQHVVAWQQAFSDVGLRVRGTVVHGAIGMGGDRLVAHVAGESAEWAVGDDIRAAHDRHLRELLPTITELDGATELLERLAGSHTLVLASSGEQDITDQLLARVEGARTLTTVVTGSEVENSKPAPDLLLEAARRAGSGQAIVIGDSVWDVRAAESAGLPCIALCSGGNSATALQEAGAAWVYDDLRSLLASLAGTPLGA